MTKFIANWASNIGFIANGWILAKYGLWWFFISYAAILAFWLILYGLLKGIKSGDFIADEVSSDS